MGCCLVGVSDDDTYLRFTTAIWIGCSPNDRCSISFNLGLPEILTVTSWSSPLNVSFRMMVKAGMLLRLKMTDLIRIIISVHCHNVFKRS